MKKNLKKTLIITYLFILLVLLLEPYMSKASVVLEEVTTTGLTCPLGYTKDSTGTKCTKTITETTDLIDPYLTRGNSSQKYYLTSNTESTYFNDYRDYWNNLKFYETTNYVITDNYTNVEFTYNTVYEWEDDYYADCVETSGSTKLILCKYKLTTTANISCPTGYTLSNNTCAKTTIETINATQVAEDSGTIDSEDIDNPKTGDTTLVIMTSLIIFSLSVITILTKELKKLFK